MATTQSTRHGYLCFSRDFFFSLNIALVAELLGNQRPNWFFSNSEYGESSLALRMNALLHLHSHSTVGANAAFFVFAFAWAICLFVLLRISSRAPLVQTSLSSIAGVVSLLMLPLSWLFISHSIGSDSVLSGPPWVLLFIELSIATVCAVMFMSTKWFPPRWVGIPLLVLHFAFWEAVCFGPYFWRAPFQSIFAIVGFCAALTWSCCVSVQRRLAHA